MGGAPRHLEYHFLNSIQITWNVLCLIVAFLPRKIHNEESHRLSFGQLDKTYVFLFGGRVRWRCQRLTSQKLFLTPCPLMPVWRYVRVTNNFFFSFFCARTESVASKEAVTGTPKEKFAKSSIFIKKAVFRSTGAEQNLLRPCSQ